MEYDPKDYPPSRADDPASFAYLCSRSRWPVALTNTVDDVHRTVLALPSDEEEKIAQGKRIIEQLGQLRYAIQHNRVIPPLEVPVNGTTHDHEAVNQELASLGPITWCNNPVLFAECFLFRSIHNIFETKSLWKHYDAFSRQKQTGLRHSHAAVFELAQHYHELVPSIRASSSVGTEEDRAREEAVFLDMCKICLWGNLADLTLLGRLTHAELSSLQGKKAQEANEEKILANDAAKVFDLLNTIKQKALRDSLLQKLKAAGSERYTLSQRVDIVMDNFGFEMFCDLVLAAYLLSTQLATQVVLHAKAMPWFLSDTTPADFVVILQALMQPRKFFGAAAADEDNPSSAPIDVTDEQLSHMQTLVQDITRYHADGQLVLRADPVWTRCGSFWRLPYEDEELYDDLASNSRLVIFKGDLNYRKLVGDLWWPPAETSFAQAIGPLNGQHPDKRQPGTDKLVKGLNVLALRTVKSDTVVGLAPGKDEELGSVVAERRLKKHRETHGADSKEPYTSPREWAWHGEWAVMQFHQGKE